MQPQGLIGTAIIVADVGAISTVITVAWEGTTPTENIIRRIVAVMIGLEYHLNH